MAGTLQAFGTTHGRNATHAPGPPAASRRSRWSLDDIDAVPGGAGLIIGSLAACGAVTWALGASTLSSRYWFFFPIMLAAARFRWRGALITALVAGVLAGPAAPTRIPLTEEQLLSLWISRALFFSALQLSTPDLLEQLEHLLAETHIPPGWLCLEITETAAIADLDGIADKLAEARTLGIQTAIDDFGVGHNSLKHLHRLPVDIVKVDRSFIGGLADHEGHGDMAAAVIALARTLGMQTVAEGIETPDQAAHLRFLGADFAQGFLFGRSQPASAIQNLVRKRRPGSHTDTDQEALKAAIRYLGRSRFTS